MSRFFRPSTAPALLRYELVTKHSAAARRIRAFALVQSAAITALIGAVIRVFFDIGF